MSETISCSLHFFFFSLSPLFPFLSQISVWFIAIDAAPHSGIKTHNGPACTWEEPIVFLFFFLWSHIRKGQTFSKDMGEGTSSSGSESSYNETH